MKPLDFDLDTEVQWDLDDNGHKPGCQPDVIRDKLFWLWPISFLSFEFQCQRAGGTVPVEIVLNATLEEQVRRVITFEGCLVDLCYPDVFLSGP